MGFIMFDKRDKGEEGEREREILFVSILSIIICCFVVVVNCKDLVKLKGFTNSSLSFLLQLLNNMYII